MPTMRAKNNEMQRKFQEFDTERKGLQEENDRMKTFKTDSD